MVRYIAIAVGKINVTDCKTKYYTLPDTVKPVTQQ